VTPAADEDVPVDDAVVSVDEGCDEQLAATTTRTRMLSFRTVSLLVTGPNLIESLMACVEQAACRIARDFFRSLSV
jgi:hypothetical protein